MFTVECGPGTYFSNDTMDCELCGAGTYKDYVGASECMPCPNGTVTEANGTKEEAMCIGRRRMMYDCKNA